MLGRSGPPELPPGGGGVLHEEGEPDGARRGSEGSPRHQQTGTGNTVPLQSKVSSIAKLKNYLLKTI